jgi:hypothetical protein
MTSSSTGGLLLIQSGSTDCVDNANLSRLQAASDMEPKVNNKPGGERLEQQVTIVNEAKTSVGTNTSPKLGDRQPSDNFKESKPLDSVESKTQTAATPVTPIKIADDDNSTDNSNGLMCRICHCEETSEEYLITPCYCSGTLRFVHQSCLQQWLKSNGNISFLVLV